MASWQKKAAKLASGATGGAAARIAELAQQAANKQMTRREFLQKVGVVAGTAAVNTSPLSKLLPPIDATAQHASDFFVVPLQHTLPETSPLLQGFRVPGVGQINAIRDAAGVPHVRVTGKARRRLMKQIPRMDKQGMEGVMQLLEQVRAAAAGMPKGVESRYNAITQQWHPMVAVSHEDTADGYMRKLAWLRDPRLPHPWDDDLTAKLDTAMEYAHAGQSLTHAGKTGATLLDDLKQRWLQHRKDIIEQAKDAHESSVSRAQALDDLGRAAGGRANDPMPPTAMRRHPLGMESMGLPGDEERDDFGRVKRVFGVALPLSAAAAGSGEQNQPRLLDGLRN